MFEGTLGEARQLISETAAAASRSADEHASVVTALQQEMDSLQRELQAVTKEVALQTGTLQLISNYDGHL